jgi:hypothetical protein
MLSSVHVTEGKSCLPCFIDFIFSLLIGLC